MALVLRTRVSQEGRDPHSICTGKKCLILCEYGLQCLLSSAAQSSYTSDVKQAGPTASAQMSPCLPPLWADTAPGSAANINPAHIVAVLGSPSKPRSTEWRDGRMLSITRKGDIGAITAHRKACLQPRLGQQHRAARWPPAGRSRPGMDAPTSANAPPSQFLPQAFANFPSCPQNRLALPLGNSATTAKGDLRLRPRKPLLAPRKVDFKTQTKWPR